MQAQLEKLVTEQRTIESRIESQRQQHDEANDHLNTVQGQYYSLGAEISGVEQNIKHQQDLQQRDAAHLAEAEATIHDQVGEGQQIRGQLDEREAHQGEERRQQQRTGILRPLSPASRPA